MSSQVASSQSSSPKRSKTAQGPAKVLPLRYELCDVEDMVVLIANMLSELIETNDSLAMKSGHLTRFHSRSVHQPSPSSQSILFLPPIPLFTQFLTGWHRLTPHPGLPLGSRLSITYTD
jgi:hypothetical protein